MIQARTIDELRDFRRAITGRVGLVPTMGALHEGHLALIDAARSENSQVIVTIFINPKQFSVHEDLDRYPRDLDRDLALLEQHGVDLVFLPTSELMYPDGFSTYVTVEGFSDRLEGERRPEHFRGVTTVVGKLFNLAQPDMAYFGQKDVQQVVILRRMVSDLNFPLEIVICPTVREADGLAMSSRNTYLTGDQRAIASLLYQALKDAATVYEHGERNPMTVRQVALNVLSAEKDIDIDYVELVNPNTLDPVEAQTNTPILMVVAAKIGEPRLLDNCLLPWDLNTRTGLGMVFGSR